MIEVDDARTDLCLLGAAIIESAELKPVVTRSSAPVAPIDFDGVTNCDNG